MKIPKENRLLIEKVLDQKCHQREKDKTLDSVDKIFET